MSKRIITNATAGVTLPDSVVVGKPITIQVAPEGKYPQFVDDDTAEGESASRISHCSWP